MLSKWRGQLERAYGVGPSRKVAYIAVLDPILAPTDNIHPSHACAPHCPAPPLTFPPGTLMT